MLSKNVLLALVAAMSVSAVPLNINLGAYSPALVVGDGEISFGGSENAAGLMETLATGAAANANRQGQGQGQQQQGGGEGNQPQQQKEEQKEEQPPQEAAAAGEAAGGVEASEAIRNGLDPGSFPNMVKRDSLDTSDNLANLDEGRKLKQKRAIDGFREALQFAREAQKDTPKLELGSENAGVGIIQNAGTNVQANSAANGAKPPGGRRVKREEQEEARSEKQGITLLAIAEI